MAEQNNTLDNSLAASITAAGSIGGATINAASNARARKWQSQQLAKQRAFESEQAEISRNWSEYMWNLQNAYNTPLNQLKLYQQAGGNPVDFFGGNSSLDSAAQTAPSAAQANAPSGPNPTTLPIGSLISDAFNSIANNTLAFASARKADKESQKIEVDMKYVNEQIKKTIAETKCTDEQARLLNKTANLYDKMTEAQIKSLNAAAELAAQHIKESVQNIKESEARTGLTKAQKEGQLLQNAVNTIKANYASKFGVILDGDGLTSLITLLCGENGDKLVAKLGKNLGGIFTASVDSEDSILENIKSWFRRKWTQSDETHGHTSEEAARILTDELLKGLIK